VAQSVLLTGIRASGEIHLGNYLGAIRNAVARQNDFQSYFFVADFHGLTTSPDANDLRNNVRAIAAAWLASGLDPDKTFLWKQSDVPEVLQLSYVLSCVTSMGLLERAHSYKDALQKNKVVRAGLFYYPVLMAADILLFNADLVPVGKDQAQHLEMARDIATFFNERYGELFRLPKEHIEDSCGVIPGTDGRKMSKSYGNGIDIFAPEAQLKKQIMGIQTDSKSLEEPKVAEDCIPFQLYRLIASSQKTEAMKSKLEAGGYGYGTAKKELLSEILETYGSMRQRYQEWIAPNSDLDDVLRHGAAKVRPQAQQMLDRVYSLVGL
jgi:tryptophanyl-tRNA synthetase